MSCANRRQARLQNSCTNLIADDALAGGHDLPDELRRAPVLGNRTVVEGRNEYVGIEEESSVVSAK